MKSLIHQICRRKKYKISLSTLRPTALPTAFLTLRHQRQKLSFVRPGN